MLYPNFLPTISVAFRVKTKAGREKKTSFHIPRYINVRDMMPHMRSAKSEYVAFGMKKSDLRISKHSGS